MSRYIDLALDTLVALALMMVVGFLLFCFYPLFTADWKVIL